MALLVFFATAAGAGIIAPHAHAFKGRGIDTGTGVAGSGFGLAGFGGCGVGHVGDVLSAGLQLLGRLIQLGRGLHLHRHQDLGDFVLDVIDQLTEQLKRFALVFLLGLLLGVATQMDALAQIVQCAGGHAS